MLALDLPFCNLQSKQRGKTEGGVKTYRWNLEQFLVFVRHHHGRLVPRLGACLDRAPCR